MDKGECVLGLVAPQRQRGSSAYLLPKEKRDEEASLGAVEKVQRELCRPCALKAPSWPFISSTHKDRRLSLSS